MRPLEGIECESQRRLVTDDYGEVVECPAKSQTDDFGNEIGPAWQQLCAEGTRLAASDLHLTSDEATNEGDNHG